MVKEKLKKLLRVENLYTFYNIKLIFCAGKMLSFFN